MKSVLTRRTFLKNMAAAAGILTAGCSVNPVKTHKREAMLALKNDTGRQDYIPAAFFLHFDKQYHTGRPAVEKHLEYFRYTDMDFVKIQYERTFPPIPEIQTPADWKNVPIYKKDFFEPQLQVVEGLVKEAKNEALVLVTLYSPFMCARQSSPLLTAHIEEDAESVKKGMERITESVLLFVRECVKAGVDGFYASTQGGERGRFSDTSLFREYVRPYDLAVMNEIDESCIFNILHICDYDDAYADITPFLDYPGDVVTCPLKIGSTMYTPRELYAVLNRPYMGGLDRHGIIATGSPDETKTTVSGILSEAPERFVLGADCTVPGETNWDNLRTAITAAHEYRY